MLALSTTRIAARYLRGQRPYAEDMEEVVRYVRRRRQQGLPPIPPILARLAGRPGAAGRAASGRWLRDLQEHKFRKTVRYAYRYVPFYREALDAQGVKPSDIRSLADIRKLPITRRQHLAEDIGAFISRYPGLMATTMAHTGGTSGRPLKIYLTHEELRYYAAGEALTGLIMGWLGPAEILQTHFTADEALESIVLTRAAHQAGTLVLTYGTQGTLERHVESIFSVRNIPGKKPKVSWLMASPSHLWALTRRAEELGVDFKDSGVERITTGGAMVSEELKQRIKEAWGIPLTEGYGVTETVTCAAAQCSKSERLHFSDMTGYAEVLDAQTEEPVPPGQPGVLTITNFYPDRELMPLLRYWTNDLVIVSPDRTCACGLPTTQILDIVGRADHMVKVGLQAYYPQEIGDSLLAFPELVLPPRFALRIEQREDAHCAILDVEQAASLSPAESEQLRQRIAKGIVVSRYWEVTIGAIRLIVNLHPAGSLENPFPYKHRHLVLAQRAE